MDVRVTLVGVPEGDWYGLFVNDRLMMQGHTISVAGALDLMVGKTVTSFERFDCDSKWLQEIGGTFPDQKSQNPISLKDVVRA